MLKECFGELERRLLEEIKTCYGERLVSVALFGSAGRETQRFDSDVDVLLIAKDLPVGRMKRVREFEEVEKRLEPQLTELKKKGIDTRISAVIKTPEEATAGSPLFLDMVDDAKLLYDRGGFFAKRLAELRRKLDALGARRVWRGSAWYWDLKPDYKKGDVIEL
jgi:predicted nucleotidyltransferase